MIKYLFWYTLPITITFCDITSQSYSAQDIQGPFNPDFSTVTHTVEKKDLKPEFHPVYKGDELKNEKRGMSEKHKEMLADQPIQSTEVNRMDNVANPNHGYFPPPMEVAYPDIQYAPAYGYDSGYQSNNYDNPYDTSLINYLENDNSPFGFFWNLVPRSRTFVSYIGNAVSWFFSSIFVLLLGSIITIGACTYTNVCKITFNGVGPIHEEMRSLITPERLEKLSTAADFVKTAINKYQNIQKPSKVENVRSRRSLFYY